MRDAALGAAELLESGLVDDEEAVLARHEPLATEPIIAGRLFDIFGNYTNAFYVGSGICILALGSLLLAKRPEVSAMAGVEAIKGAKAA